MQPNVQTFKISLPKETHRMAANCEDVDCDQFLNGWKTVVDIGSPMGEAQQRYLRLNPRKLAFSEIKVSEYEVAFIYPPGQECFRDHTRLNGREPYYLHETAAGRRVHQRGEDFMEHAHEEIEKNIGLEDRRNG